MAKITESDKKSKTVSTVTSAIEGVKMPQSSVQSVTECAVKYNRTQNDTYQVPKVSQQVSKQPFTLIIDWLEIHYKSTLHNLVFCEGIFSTKNIRIERIERPTKSFLSFARVFVNGRELGVVRYNPRNEISYKNDSSSFKIENERFYTGDWFKLLKIYEREIGATCKNITRLDIALDTPCNNVFRFVELYTNTPLKKRKIRQLGRTKIHTTNSAISNTSERSLRQFDIGKPSKGGRFNKMLTGYCKTLELSEKEHKQYISRFHENNFGKNHADVYRYELRFASRAIKELFINTERASMDTGELLPEQRKITLRDLSIRANLSKIFELSIKNFFEFCPTTGAKNISRRSRYKLFNFKNETDASFVRKRKKPQASTRTIKINIKHLTNTILRSGTKTTTNKNAYIRVIKNELSQYNLTNWFIRSYDTWVESLLRDCKNTNTKLRTNPNHLFDLIYNAA